MNPRVSVVVPAYNNADFLADTLESILAQDYDDYELVIADHSSSDRTAQVLGAYAARSRVRVLAPTPAGGGALANWNRVSEHAHGEFIKLVCGDDLIAPSALREQVQALDRNPTAVFVASPRKGTWWSATAVWAGCAVASPDARPSGARFGPERISSASRAA